MDQLISMGGAVGQRLKDRGETVGVSESSTGGLVSAALLSVPGASAYFMGGAAVYTFKAREEVKMPPGTPKLAIRYRL